MNVGNGDYVEYTYDKLDRVSYKKYNGTNLGFWGYYANGQVGYFYDYASGKLYYYFYDGIGRFINADTYTATDADGILSSNMFAYCENNLVNHIDPTGEFLGTLLGAAAGAVCGAVGALTGALGAATTTITKPIVKNLGSGLKYVRNKVACELGDMLSRTSSKTIKALQFDKGVTAVTNFGNWLFSKWYDTVRR